MIIPSDHVDSLKNRVLLQFSWCKSMQLIETIFDLIIFNGRPLASLVRLTQTISGRLGRTQCLRLSAANFSHYMTPIMQ